MHRTATFAATLAALAFLAACDSPSAPAEEAFFDGAELSAASLDRGDPAGFDDFGARIPGFGGLWFDRACNLNVVLTADADPEQAKQVLIPLLRRKLASSRCPDGATIIVHRGQFTYAELVRWIHEMRPLTVLRGVLGLHLSIPHNRIVVGVATREVAGEVLAALERLGIPADAVRFRVATDRG